MLTSDQLLATLWRRKVSFLLGFVLIMGAVTLVTFTQSKVYSATAFIFVGTTRAAGSDFEATQTNQVVLKTYAELLQTRSVSADVARALVPPRSAEGVERAVSVSPISQSQLIRITAESGTPGGAQALANTYAEIFVDRAARLSTDTGGGITSTLADRAALDDRPIRPRPRVYLPIGAFLAALLAAGVAMVRDRFDQHLEIDEGATELFGIPILARVPQQAATTLRELVRFSGDGHPQSVLSEAFDLLLTNIVFAGLGTGDAKSIAVVSAGEGEGKSTCAIGLARAAVRHSLQVLLVDSDLRRGRLSSMLGLAEAENRGASHLLVEGPTAWRTDDLGTEVTDGLHVLSAGAHVPQPTSLLSGAIPAFERWAAQSYSLVVFDTSPVAVGADASLVAAATGEVLLVVDVRSARRTSMQQTIDQLSRVHANVVGIVLNRTNPTPAPHGYYTEQLTRRGDHGASTKA